MPLHLPEWRRPRQLGVKEKGAYANLLQPEVEPEPEPERRDSTTSPDLSPVQARRTEIPVPVVRPGSGRGRQKRSSSSKAGKTVSFSPSDGAVEPAQVDGEVLVPQQQQQQEQQSMLAVSDDRSHDSLLSKPVKRGFSMDFSLLSPSSSSHHHGTARAALAKLSPNQHSNVKARPAKAEVTKESKHALSPAARLAQSRSKGAGGKAVRQAEAVLTLISGATLRSAQQDTGSGGGGGVQMSSKQLKELKSALGKPIEANRIIDELKKLPSPPVDAPVATTSLALTGSTVAPAHPAAKGVCLDCPDVEVLPKHEHASALASASSPASSPSKGKSPPPPPLPRRPSASASDVRAEDTTSTLLNGKFGVFSGANGLPTPGKILGQIATSSGAFDALAGVTGRLIDSSGAHNGALKPPDDRLSVLVYWWGYEVILPPPTIAYLASVNSIAGTAFTFLQALAAGGGVPELVPFIRYLSMYIDMEWKAIQQQNKGRGVVLAATWIVPVAVVPRPLQFA